jgi:hypothetical protein
MERMAWTDERLDDLAKRMDAGFERVDADIRDLRADMNAMRTELRGEIDRLRLTMVQVGGAGVLSLLVAILARG